MEREKPSGMRQRTPAFFARIDLWMQAWCLRGYAADTHAWCAKMERLRSLKVTSRQTLRTSADVRLLSKLP